MYNTLDTLPDNVRASLDISAQQHWMSVYNQAIKKASNHRTAVFKAWDYVKAEPSCRYFAGFVSTERIDKQNDSVIAKGAYDKISKFIERGGFITDTHSNRLVGSFYHAELRKTPRGGDGVYAYGVIFRGEPYFDTTWQAIKKAVDCPSCHDVRKGTSIGGFALDTEISCDGMQCHRNIIDLSIHEISICADPANPDALIDQINHFAKADSVVPDGSDVVKKALVENNGDAEMMDEGGMAQGLGAKSPEDLNGAAIEGANQAGEMLAEDQPQQGGGLVEAMDGAIAGKPQEGQMLSLDEIKMFKEKFKNTDKIIRELGAIKEMLMGNDGTDGTLNIDASGAAPTEPGAEEMVEPGAEAGMEEGVEPSAQPVQKNRHYVGPSPYSQEMRNVHSGDKFINTPVDAVTGAIGLVGSAFDASKDPLSGTVGIGSALTGGVANAAGHKAEGAKLAEVDRRLKAQAEAKRKAPQGAGQVKPVAPAQPKGLEGMGGDKLGIVADKPAPMPQKAAVLQQARTPAPVAKPQVAPAGQKKTARAGAVVGDKNKPATPASGPAPAFQPMNEAKKSCGCMNTDIHTPITESKCPMKPLLYGDQIDPEKLKFLDNKQYEEKSNPIKGVGGMDGAVKLKGWLKAEEGPVSETKEEKNIGKSDMKAHIKEDLKDEKKIISTAEKMEKEDKEELEKSDVNCSKKFLSKYGPKNEANTVKEGGAIRERNMGKEGKEVFMKSTDEFGNEIEEQVEEEVEEQVFDEGADAGVDELVEGAEEVVEQDEMKEAMSAKELISMVIQFLQENGVEVGPGAQAPPMDNPAIEDEIQKPESEIAFESYQDMEDAECLGKMAMHKMQMAFTENRINLMDSINKADRENYDKWQVSGGTGRKFKHRMREGGKKYKSDSKATKIPFKEPVEPKAGKK